MLNHDIIKTDIGRHYETIPNSKFPIFYHPNSNVLSVSDTVIFKQCSTGEYDESIIDLVAFIKDVRFATLDQIQRAFPDREFNQKNMMQLVKEYILNAIVLGEREDHEVFGAKDAMVIFTLDIGGTYILNYAGLDANKWTLKESHVSARVMKKMLAQCEYYLKICSNPNLSIRSFRPRRSFSLGRTVAEVDFSMSIEKEGGRIQNILGYVVEDGLEDLQFAESIKDLNSIFNDSQAWKKDYPISEKPALTLIVYTKESFTRVLRILATVADYHPSEINIMMYPHLIQIEDIQDIQVFSYSMNQSGQIKPGRHSRHALT